MPDDAIRSGRTQSLVPAFGSRFQAQQGRGTAGCGPATGPFPPVLAWTPSAPLVADGSGRPAANAWAIGILWQHLEQGSRVEINDRFYPYRPPGSSGLLSRLRLAWAVFTGRADALFWPGQGSTADDYARHTGRTPPKEPGGR